jgi:hypothetical protein
LAGGLTAFGFFFILNPDIFATNDPIAIVHEGSLPNYPATTTGHYFDAAIANHVWSNF